MSHSKILELVIEKVGSPTKLAKACGVTPQAVNGWKVRGQIPAGKCKTVEKLTGIKRKELRPDIFK